LAAGFNSASPKGASRARHVTLAAALIAATAGPSLPKRVYAGTKAVAVPGFVSRSAAPLYPLHRNRKLRRQPFHAPTMQRGGNTRLSKPDTD